MKKKAVTIILFIVAIAGLSLLLYPSVSNYWNRKHSTQAITNYRNEIDAIGVSRYKEIWNDAVAYNESLPQYGGSAKLTDERRTLYNSLLNVTGSGIMGYVEIKKMDVSLPIYHGTDDSVLRVGIGHLEWTSLPVGGLNSHCVISGHRGIPSAKLFKDLDDLREGDTFMLHVLGETLTYEVDLIRTVEPKNISGLAITPGKDYCTLVTCTPYGINTHRLLVRGHRIENDRAEVSILSEAIVIEPVVVAPALAFPLLFILLMMVIFKKPEKKPTADEILQSRKRRRELGEAAEPDDTGWDINDL